jgi:DNA invertase Pin-like site-specific DNA recombinase
MMATIIAGIADFERELLQERIRSGIAAAKARGKRLGRQPGQRPKSGRHREDSAMTPLAWQRARYAQVASVRYPNFKNESTIIYLEQGVLQPRQFVLT